MNFQIYSIFSLFIIGENVHLATSVMPGCFPCRSPFCTEVEVNECFTFFFVNSFFKKKRRFSFSLHRLIMEFVLVVNQQCIVVKLVKVLVGISDIGLTCFFFLAMFKQFIFSSSSSQSCLSIAKAEKC